MTKLAIRTRKFCRRFIGSERAVAAIEFAMIAPVLVVLCLASVDGGRALSIYMKIRAATYALAAITNQYPTVQTSDLTSIMNATTTILAPYSTSPLKATVSQISINSRSAATVSWSYSQGGTALAAGSSVTVPSGMSVASSYLILAQVTYTYSPLFGYFGGGSGIALSDYLYMTPRSSQCVLYPTGNVTSC
jgi:Flp pilus assembly protein TadG